jgi:hypothetical protein
MQLASASARPDAVFLIEPFALAVNLQAGAIDKLPARCLRRDGPSKAARKILLQTTCELGLLGRIIYYSRTKR